MSATNKTETEQLNADNTLFYPEIKETFLVNQSPALINLRQNLTITERRIIAILIALIQPDDTDFRMYVLRAKDFAKLLGIKGNGVYTQLEKSIDSLMKKQLTIEREDGNIVHKYQWLTRASYIRNKGEVQLRLSDDLKRYLLSLESYIKYRLLNVLFLKSDHAWRIYELLKEETWKTKEKKEFDGKTYTKYRIMTVKEIRRLLDIQEDQYVLMKHFKSRILDVAQKEITTKTDISFKYDVYKKIGRSIDSFIFYIESNGKNLSSQINLDAQQDDIKQVLNELIRYNVRRDKAIEILEKYNQDYIEHCLRYVSVQSKEVSHRNRAGYIIRAIEENYINWPSSILKTEEEDTPFNSIVLSQLNERLKLQNENDTNELKRVVTREQRMLATSGVKTQEEVEFLGKERDRIIFEFIDMIQLQRKKKGWPPLSSCEILEDPASKKYLELWEKETVDIY